MDSQHCCQVSADPNIGPARNRWVLLSFAMLVFRKPRLELLNMPSGMELQVQMWGCKSVDANLVWYFSHLSFLALLGSYWRNIFVYVVTSDGYVIIFFGLRFLWLTDAHFPPSPGRTGTFAIKNLGSQTCARHSLPNQFVFLTMRVPRSLTIFNCQLKKHSHFYFKASMRENCVKWHER